MERQSYKHSLCRKEPEKEEQGKPKASCRKGIIKIGDNRNKE
jgi:hypothetical protein